MPKSRTGSIYNRDGVIYARVTFIDSIGKRKQKWRRADSRTHARELIKQMLRDLDDHGPEFFDYERMTFADLAEHYKMTYLIPPQYVDERKVAGRRDWRRFRQILEVLTSHFGKRCLSSIAYSDIDQFRIIRLNTKTKRGTQRAIATVHRELALLRRVLNVAVRNGWMIRNPFNSGESLIHTSDERARERILTIEEEDRLLAACSGPRAHIRPIVIAALDTGMRIGEILKLTWDDIDFENQIITVRAFNTKTMRTRYVAMTPRLFSALSDVYESSTKDSTAPAFGVVDTIKTAFNTARRLAGVADVRIHDLRHTAATRLVQGHLPLSEVGRILGHTQANTTFRYVNANIETARRAADALASFREDKGLASENSLVN
jgi:integrase